MSKHTEKSHDRATCPDCQSSNIYGMSRVVGYYSIIENWNDSKKAELKDRQSGVYKLGEKPKTVCVEPNIAVETPQTIKVAIE